MSTPKSHPPTFFIRSSFPVPRSSLVMERRAGVLACQFPPTTPHPFPKSRVGQASPPAKSRLPSPARHAPPATPALPHPHLDGMAEQWIATHQKAYESGQSHIFASCASWTKATAATSATGSASPIESYGILHGEWEAARKVDAEI